MLIETNLKTDNIGLTWQKGTEAWLNGHIPHPLHDT